MLTSVNTAIVGPNYLLQSALGDPGTSQSVLLLVLTMSYSDYHTSGSDSGSESDDGSITPRPNRRTAPSQSQDATLGTTHPDTSFVGMMTPLEELKHTARTQWEGGLPPSTSSPDSQTSQSPIHHNSSDEDENDSSQLIPHWVSYVKMSTPKLDGLPVLVLLLIASYLNPTDWLSLASTCRTLSIVFGRRGLYQYVHFV